MSEPEAILWLLAEGCYNKEQLEQAAGRIYMQALWDLIKRSPLYQELYHEAVIEGKAIGIAEGKAEGEIGLVLRQLERCIGPLPASQEEAIRRLRVSEIEELGEALLSFSSPADLADWLRRNN
jgi:predicted transposase YdaD